MKRYALILLSLIVLCMIACQKEPALEKLPDLTPDYVLPEGKSPADPRIVDLYTKYGAYFLYDFKDADFWWYYEYKPQDSKATYYYTKSDPASVGLMLDFLDQAFFRFYTQDFIKKKIRLYKVMLIDTMKFRLNNPPDWPEVAELRYCRMVAFPGGSTQLALGRVAPRFAGYDAATKTAYKNDLHRQIWQTIGNNFGNEVPQAFIALSDYTKVADFNTASPDYYLRRGFYSTSTLSASGLNAAADFAAYISKMAQSTPASLQAEWNQYPLLKQKYDIVRNFLITKHGVDLEAIFAFTF